MCPPVQQYINYLSFSSSGKQTLTFSTNAKDLPLQRYSENSVNAILDIYHSKGYKDIWSGNLISR